MKAGLRRPRSAWVEVDLAVLADNCRRIRADLPPSVQLMYVVKDDAYGIGAVQAARVALAHGASSLAVSNLNEAAELREAGLAVPILLLGERLPEELPHVLELELEASVGRREIAEALAELGRRRNHPIPVHLKINTGMNRFGFSWRDCPEWSAQLAQLRGLEWVGVLSHFAQSDELEKTFAQVQARRFQDCLRTLLHAGLNPQRVHQCNSGGFLDLAWAHFDVVRIGLLAQGVYPSAVCRRLPGLQPVMSVKARLTALQELQIGDTVGYGMRWQALRPSRVGVLSLGYGDGFPRVRNQGFGLVRGQRCPIVGGVTMDALMLDLTDCPGAAVGDEVVLMGRQGDQEISIHELAGLKQSVSYDLLAGWRARLPRRYLGGEG